MNNIYSFIIISPLDSRIYNIINSMYIHTELFFSFLTKWIPILQCLTKKRSNELMRIMFEIIFFFFKSTVILCRLRDSHIPFIYYMNVCIWNATLYICTLYIDLEIISHTIWMNIATYIPSYKYMFFPFSVAPRGIVK